jgi:hypothetical protein
MGSLPLFLLTIKKQGRQKENGEHIPQRFMTKVLAVQKHFYKEQIMPFFKAIDQYITGTEPYIWL